MKKKATRGTGGPDRLNIPDDPEQSKRFEEKARELGADESGKKFEDALTSVVPRKPPPSKGK